MPVGTVVTPNNDVKRYQTPVSNQVRKLKKKSYCINKYHLGATSVLVMSFFFFSSSSPLIQALVVPRVISTNWSWMFFRNQLACK